MGKEAFGQAGKSFECQWLLLADFVRMGLEAARFPTAFQAEYEGYHWSSLSQNRCLLMYPSHNPNHLGIV
jgi:hypothetical protein